MHTIPLVRSILFASCTWAPLSAQAGAPGPASADGAQAQAEPDAPVRSGAAPSDDAFRMGSPPVLPDGVSEEEIWPAATAEGWAKPCLVRWQRTFDDALRVANARHQPLLVAVNMDGEIASEHFAGVRYRDPEVAAQLERYACVIASVYRHTPRDYDENGQRVECPRFGTVTCGEHIQCERELYERYFDGLRVAPRHIVLGLEGQETYDVYYAWDTETVFTTFTKGVEGWPLPRDPIEPTPLALTRSADVRDREELEQTYRAGDRETRREILQALIDEPVVDQLEVLRSALHGLDLELATLSRRALAECRTEEALDLIAEVLKTPLEATERERLLRTVADMGTTSKRARTLSALHSGLSQSSRHIEARAPAELSREYEANAARGTLVLARFGAASTRPSDPAELLELAEALLERANELPQSRFSAFVLEDACSAAQEAQAAGARGPRLDGVLALLAAERGERAVARERAVAAVEGGLLRAADGDASVPEVGTVVRARLLRLFAEARERAIRAAYRAGEDWPAEWLSDVSAAYASLSEDPQTGAEALVRFHDFLRWIGATQRADEALEDALRRFPEDPLLHDRLRTRLLWERGAEGLEAEYAERLARERAMPADEPSQLQWYAGYASLVAAEQHRRQGKRSEAEGAYGRSIALFEQHAESVPGAADNAAHFTALCHAGLARLALEAGELGAATSSLLAALAERPDSAASPDGLNLTPIQTAKMLRARLIAGDDTERAGEVQAALEALDPTLLEPPPSERPVPARRRGGRARSGG